MIITPACCQTARYLVVAGHSRTIAVVDIACDKSAEQYILNCKIHPISSPEDIINLQLEKIYTQAILERTGNGHH